MKKTESMTLTQKRIKSPKLLVYIASGAALAVDLVLFIVLLAGGYSFLFLLAPILFLLADGGLLVLSIFTNFRFRYAIAEYAAYIPVVALGIVCECLAFGSAAGEIVTRTARLLFITAHVFTCLAVLFTCLRAARTGKGVKLLAVALTAIMLALGAGYVAFVIGSGVFGQSFDGRTVVYTYDEEREGYVASDVIDGYSNRVYIPTHFNGEPVVGVDCGLFTREDVTAVSLGCETDVAFLSAQKLAGADLSRLNVYADKEDFDAFRGVFFSLAYEEKADCYLTLADRFLPNLGKGEVFIDFSYDLDTLNRVGGETLPTWFGNRGDEFSLSYFEGEKHVSYLDHGDDASDDDLDWSFLNTDGYILRAFVSGGAPVAGRQIAESIPDLPVVFDKIYRVYFDEDNDGKYEPDAAYAFSTVGGVRKDFRYMTAAHADAFLHDGAREGFDVSWTYAAASGAGKRTFSLLSELMASGNVTGSSIYLQAEWELRAPVITQIGTDRAGNSAVYGEDASFSAAAEAPVAGIQLRYSWQFPDTSERGGETNANFNLVKLDPRKDKGNYTLTVTAYSDTLTDLTSFASSTLTLSVAKKNLPCSWTMDGENVSSKVYDARDFSIVCTPDEDSFVAGDGVTGHLSGETVIRDAGSREFTFELDEQWNELYSLVNGSRTFTVRRASLQIDWKLDGGDTFTVVYDGAVHSIVPSGTVLDGDVGTVRISLVELNEIKNAGSYSFSAGVNSGNYSLVGATRSVTVQKRPITVVWEEPSYTYDGGEHAPSVVSVDGEAEGEEETALALIEYTGDTAAKDAGNYTVRATLKNGNYTFASEQSKSFAIARRNITFTWEEPSYTYDGTVHFPKVASTDAIRGEDELVRGGILYTGDTSKKDAGEGYTVRAALPEPSNYTLISGESKTFSIAKREISFTWEDTAYTYDGAAHSPKVGSTNAVAGEDSLVRASIVYSGDTAAVNAGDSYTVRAALPETTNYTLVSGDSKSFSIARRNIAFTWEDPSYTYDGTAHSPKVISTNAVAGEDASVRASIVYSGNTDVVNAGESYTVRAALPEPSNYTLVAGGSKTFSIAKRAVTLAAQPIERTYDGAVYGGEVRYRTEGLAPGDEESDVLGAVTYTGDVLTKKNAGTYTARLSYAGGAKVGNYTVTTADAAYTVSQKRVTLVWGEGNFTYNGSEQKITASSEDFVSGESGLLSFTYSGECVNAGSYTATASLSASGNYVLDGGGYTARENFDIAKKRVVLSWTEGEFKQDGEGHAPELAATDWLAHGDSVTYEYYLGGVKQTGKPVAAGSYTVRAVVAGDNYEFVGNDRAFTIAEPEEVAE